MSGINTKALQARAVLFCDRCKARWESAVFIPGRWGDDERACAPAWAIGWRVYAGARSQRTYCPDCQPTVPMRLVLGTKSTPGGAE